MDKNKKKTQSDEPSLVKRLWPFSRRSKAAGPQDRKANKSASSLRPKSVDPESWNQNKGVKAYPFPGPQGRSVALRVAFDQQPYADLIAHARESLDKEICGILVGQFVEDQKGMFVHVLAIIRGESARQGSTHVTFTQETWNRIHEDLDHHYRDQRIVGWYHTHPGFGVQFSEMDLFIQRNFFSAPHQVAVVYDPMAGQTGVCVNTTHGTEGVDCIWVDGREISCSSAAPAGTGKAGVSSSEFESERIRDLEVRVSQLVTATEDLRDYISRVLFTTMFLIGSAVCIWLGFSIYDKFFALDKPPENAVLLPAPVFIDGKAMFLGLQLISWEAPPELQEKFLQALNPPPPARKAPANKTNPVQPGSTPNPLENSRPDSLKSTGGH